MQPKATKQVANETEMDEMDRLLAEAIEKAMAKTK